MNDIIIQNAVTEISTLQARVSQLEMQQEFLIHEFRNVRRILEAEGITSYNNYLQTLIMMVGATEEGA